MIPPVTTQDVPFSPNFCPLNGSHNLAGVIGQKWYLIVILVHNSLNSRYISFHEKKIIFPFL